MTGVTRETPPEPGVEGPGTNRHLGHYTTQVILTVTKSHTPIKGEGYQSRGYFIGAQEGVPLDPRGFDSPVSGHSTESTSRLSPVRRRATSSPVERQTGLGKTVHLIPDSSDGQKKREPETTSR